MPTVMGSLFNVRVDSAKPLKRGLQSSEVLVEDRLGEDIVEALGAEPRPVGSGPMLPVSVRTAVTKQELQQPMPIPKRVVT
jgi:hypothetical protein